MAKTPTSPKPQQPPRPPLPRPEPPKPPVRNVPTPLEHPKPDHGEKGLGRPPSKS
jgi:hypothetical protein